MSALEAGSTGNDVTIEVNDAPGDGEDAAELFNLTVRRGGQTETWIYTYYASYPYFPYYSPLDMYFGAPLYDPFCYSWFPPSIPYPGKLVTFAHGKARSFQYVTLH